VAAVTVRFAVAEALPEVAVIVDVALLAATREVTVNVADVAPAATDTLAGTVAAEVLDDFRLTTSPPVGAASAIFTVAVVVAPPTSDDEAREREVGCGAVNVSAAVAEVPAVVAVKVTAVLAATALVVALNVAVVAPAATVTEAGTVTAVLDELNVTTCPPVGAAIDNVTVPVTAAPFPPSEVAGLKARLETFIVTPITLFTRPWKFIAPQPVTVSQPAAAVEVVPLGSVPLLPEVTSKNTEERPL